jgi:DNA-directed RNA polymerase subunit RPC12/RpoP
MAAAPPTPKPFREEAKTSAIQCPACGGPLTLRGFGSIERVVCPYCGSELGPEDSGALAILQQAARQRRPSVLPLHRRGKLDGIEWEILGIQWRECVVDGVSYPWQEFLLYNPYAGYRYLVFSMTDGHFTLGGALDGAPRVLSGIGHKRVEFRKTRYKHFQSAKATTIYVEGEFPWEVHVGDEAITHDYVCPPESLSIEEAYGPDGQDVNFTRMRHVGGADVWKAFGMSGSPPRPTAVGMCQPNPWKQGRCITWVSLLALLALWAVATVVYLSDRNPRVAFSRKGAALTESFTQDIVVKASEPTTLELSVRAYPLSNSWAHVDVLLVPHDREEAIGLGLTAEEWHGVSDGESWREGDQSPSTVVGDVPPGAYVMHVTPSGGTQASEIPPSDVRYDITVREDVVLLRYVLLPFVVIIAFPAIFWLFSVIFEGRRWANSDYASSE